jgi:hypothetical protein
MVNSVAALISTAIFLIVFLLISFQFLHETAAALIGAVGVFLVTYIGGTYNPNLHLNLRRRHDDSGLECHFFNYGDDDFYGYLR